MAASVTAPIPQHKSTTEKLDSSTIGKCEFEDLGAPFESKKLASLEWTEAPFDCEARAPFESVVLRGDGAGAPHSLAALNALVTAALLHQDAAKQSQRALSPELQRDAALLAETLLMLHSGQQGAASPRAAAPLEQPPASSKEEPRIEGGNIPVSFLLSA